MIEETPHKPGVIYRVLASIFVEDGDFPWDYDADALCSWVHEVFLEGYKRDVAFPSVDEAIALLKKAGYKITIIEEEQGK